MGPLPKKKKMMNKKKTKKNQLVAKRHHKVSSTLAPLCTIFGLKLGYSGAAAPIGDKVL